MIFYSKHERKFQAGGIFLPSVIPTVVSAYTKAKGTKINPMNWGVKDYSRSKDRFAAYKEAKLAGEKEFMYKGKRYSTKYAGTPRQEVGRYGIDGRPVSKENLQAPAEVHLFPKLGKFLPGHISANDGTGTLAVDYSGRGNFTDPLTKVDFKGAEVYNVYGHDNDKFIDKAISLPEGEYAEGGSPSTWNLFTNNCADNMCDAFGVPRSSGITTPPAAVDKIAEKYPTMEVTGRTEEEIENNLDVIISKGSKDILKNAEHIIGIMASPEWPEYKRKYYNREIQAALVSEGTGDLPNSRVKGIDSKRPSDHYDGIIGPETTSLLSKHKNTPIKKQGGLFYNGSQQ